MEKINAVDLFCGAGGSSWGAVNTNNVNIVAGFDIWKPARDSFKLNFPDAHVYSDRIENLNPYEIHQKIGDIDLILASPECTSHSPARGKKEVCDISRNTAFQVVCFAKEFQPRWIVLENVVSMKKWDRYKELLEKFENLGYVISENLLMAYNFGVPQRRRRLFIIMEFEGKNNYEIESDNNPLMPARNIINMNGEYTYSPLRTKQRAKATLERADRAIAELGSNEPFLIVYYSSDRAGGWQSLDVPLRTITTVDRFAYVRPNGIGHEMRMLQPPELMKAMGITDGFQLANVTRRDKIKLIGNAVCPPIISSIIGSLINRTHNE